MSEVRIEHVFKRFGDVTAVNDFDLTVKDGEFVSLLGPSGCGKTTLRARIPLCRLKNAISAWFSSPTPFGRT